MRHNIFLAALIGDLVFQSKVRAIAQAHHAEVHIFLSPIQLYSALEHFAAHERVVAIDFDSSQFDGIEVAQQVGQRFPGARVLGFCQQTDVDLIRRAKNARADVVLSRVQFEELFAQMTGTLVRDSSPT